MQVRGGVSGLHCEIYCPRSTALHEVIAGSGHQTITSSDCIHQDIASSCQLPQMQKVFPSPRAPSVHSAPAVVTPLALIIRNIRIHYCSRGFPLSPFVLAAHLRYAARCRCPTALIVVSGHRIVLSFGWNHRDFASSCPLPLADRECRGAVCVAHSRCLCFRARSRHIVCASHGSVEICYRSSGFLSCPLPSLLHSPFCMGELLHQRLRPTIARM